MTIIDPPSGWQYGFPKPIPEDRKKDSKVWLVEQGYPQSLIDELGDHFYCRYWEQSEPPMVSKEEIEEMDKQYNPISVIKLASEYRALSMVLEQFPKNSKHKAVLFIENKMEEILQKIKAE